MIIIPFSSELFFGGLLILFGAAVIIKAAFGIDIPFLKITAGLLLIYWGLSFFIDIRFANTKKHYWQKRSKVYTVTIDIDKDDA